MNDVQHSGKSRWGMGVKKGALVLFASLVQGLCKADGG